MTLTKGHCQSRFSSLREQFEKNFEHDSETGASVCVIVDGTVVASLWAGRKGKESDVAWDEQTPVNIFSCTKGALALCVSMLLDTGELDLNAPVCRYWPEFKSHGKDTISIRMILNHQAGIPGIRKDATLAQLYDPHFLPQMLQDEKPFWKPGTRHGYHAVTFGSLIDELFRRITGTSVSAFFQQEVAGPLNADFWIGLPETIESRVAQVIFPPAQPAGDQNASPDNDISKYVLPGVGLLVSDINSRTSHAIGFPAGGGIASALGLARMYAPLSLDGSFNTTTLISAEAAANMASMETTRGRDAVLPIHTSFANGFARSWGQPGFLPGQGFAIGKHAFGHPGMGGSIGFADPKNRLSFAYTTNRLNGLPSLDNRAQNLIDAVYLSLGLKNRDGGHWE